MHEPDDGREGLRLRVSARIVGLTPSVVRVLEVDGAVTLGRLHELLQITFGWNAVQPHRFVQSVAATAQHGRVAFRVWSDRAAVDAGADALIDDGWSLADAVSGAGDLSYEYGDHWAVSLDVLTRRGSLPGEPEARVVSGAGSAPADDIGGPAASAEWLAAAADDTDAMQQQLARRMLSSSSPWAEFDPAAFDVDRVNDELALSSRNGFEVRDESVRASPEFGSFILDRLGYGAAAGFRDHLAPLIRIDARARHDPVAVFGADAVAAFLLPYHWFVHRVGEHGVPITGAGFIKPAVVSEAMDALGWNTWFGGTGRQEKSTPPIRTLRKHLRVFGLLRAYNGMLVRTALGSRAATDPNVLWHAIADGLVNKAGGAAERDATVLLAVEIARAGSSPVVTAGSTSARETLMRAHRRRSDMIARGLDAVGWASSQGVAVDAEMADDLVGASASVFDELAVPASTAFGSIRDDVSRSPIAVAFATAVVAAADAYSESDPPSP